MDRRPGRLPGANHMPFERLGHVRKLFLIGTLACFVLRFETSGAALSVQQAKPQSSPKKETCIDEQERSFSKGSLRKVAAQVQKCEAGTWIIDAMNGPKDPALEKAKPCKGVKEQQYAAGVLRETKDKDKAERCENGKWVAAKLPSA